MGCCIDQEDDPWWVAGALGWLALYANIAQAQGRVGEHYRLVLAEKIGREPPEFLYRFHRRFLAAMEAAEANRC